MKKTTVWFVLPLMTLAFISDVALAITGAKVLTPTILRTTGWSQTYNGGENVNDQGKAVAVDAQGNVYVAGVSRLTGYSGVAHDQFILVKYDSQGVRQWVAHDNPNDYYLGLPVGVAVDNGLVYVGLSTWNVIGFRLTDGAKRWVGETRVSSGLGEARVMALDGDYGDHHVYLGGNGSLHKYPCPTILLEDHVTVSRSEWVVTNFANDLALHGGFIFTAGDYYGVGITQKIEAATGKLIWEDWYYEGDDIHNNPVAIAVDSQGDPVVVYQREIRTTLPYIHHIRAVKFIGASTGYLPSTRWQILLPAHTDPAGMVLDSQDNVVIAGSARSPRDPPASDLYLIKLDPMGSQLWAVYYNGGTKYLDRAVAVARDMNDGIVVTGTSSHYEPGGSISTTITQAYSASGQRLWSGQYGPFRDRRNNNPDALAVKGQTAYVCGTVGPASNLPNNDIFIIKTGPKPKIPTLRP
jgi:hypothetical protein